MPPSRFPMSSVYASLQEMSLRILHINKRYPPHVGGVERHVQELALAQSARADVQVEVLCVAEEGEGRGRAHGREGAGGCGRWERDGRVAVHRVPEWALVASNPVSPWIGRELEQSRQSRLHEVWHFHYPFPTGEAACLRQAARRAAASPRPPPLTCRDLHLPQRLRGGWRAQARTGSGLRAADPGLPECGGPDCGGFSAVGFVLPLLAGLRVQSARGALRHRSEPVSACAP